MSLLLPIFDVVFPKDLLSDPSGRYHTLTCRIRIFLYIFSTLYSHLIAYKVASLN